MFNKIKAIREAWNSGDFEQAAKLFYEFLGEVTGWSGRAGAVAAAASAGAQGEQCAAELEALQQDVGRGLPRGSETQGREAGGAIMVAFLNALPVLLPEIIKLFRR